MSASRAIRHEPKVSPLSALGAHPSPSEPSGGTGQLVSRGRDALYLTYRSMTDGPWSVAWFPSFHCGVEVQAAVAAGWDVDFYPVDLNLRIDREVIEARISDRPGPVTVIHYFGHLASDTAFVAHLCQRVSAPMIEDACHGPLVGHGTRRYSPYGDAVAYSLRKVLGTPDGGLLRLDPGRIASLLQTSSGIPTTVGRRRLRPMLRYAKRMLGLGSSPSPPALGRVPKGTRRPGDSLDAPGGYGRRISILSECLLRGMDPRNVVERRRANWRQLHDRLDDASGFQPLFADLDDGAVPLSLAVRVERREELVHRLQREAVHTYVFGRWPHPSFPSRSFPRSGRLRREILGLPVHQGLTADDLDRMSRVLRRLLPEHRIEPCRVGSGASK